MKGDFNLMNGGYDFYVEFNHTMHKMHVSDVVADNAMRDPGIEAILANAMPEDILDQLLQLCYHRGYILDNVKEWANR